MCGGASSSQKMLPAETGNFYRELQGAYNTQFANQSSILSNLHNAWTTREPLLKFAFAVDHSSTAIRQLQGERCSAHMVWHLMGGSNRARAAVLFTVGKMLDSGQRTEVKPDEARRKFDAYVRALAAGQTASELNGDEAWALGEPPCGDRTLPPDVADALGLEPGANYGDAYVAAMEVCQIEIMRKERNRTGS